MCARIHAVASAAVYKNIHRDNRTQGVLCAQNSAKNKFKSTFAGSVRASFFSLVSSSASIASLFFASSSLLAFFLFITLNSFYKCIMHVELFCVPSSLPYVCCLVTNNIESFQRLTKKERDRAWGRNVCVFYPLLPRPGMMMRLEQRIMAIYTC